MAEKARQETARYEEDNVLEEEKNCKLTYFFRDILKKRIDFQISSDEVTDIIFAVEYLVGIIVAAVSSNVIWLPFSRLVKVGSMAEGTKVGSPDEFDYLVVLDQKGVEVNRSCEQNRGYAHIKVTDPQLQRIWKKWLYGDYLQGAFTHGFSGIFPGYFDTLGNAFMYEVGEIIKYLKDDLFCSRQTGRMLVNKNIQKHGPAFTPQFLWEPHSRRGKKITINVDITPAFEVDLSEDIIKKDDTFHADFWKKIEAHGKFMLIPCHEPVSCTSCVLCFRLTFTETEVELVRGLSKHHRECYKLLKYIFSSGGGYSFMSSYAWKTLVLKHACYCKETANLAMCFKKLVATCLHYLFTRKTEEKIEFSRLVRFLMRGDKFELHIPSIFIKDHNIMDSKDFKFPCEHFLIEIEAMLQSVEDISCTENPNTADIKIVNGYMTGFASYIKSSPLVNKHLELENCVKCFERYFQKKIL
ncbi:uncharacterized protein LOC128548671 isoform X2 [Mercenaria mercenaria]|nr:uncharacterized protein LOC128548671 isoform X2 [Mercenaria mercenaria]